MQGTLSSNHKMLADTGLLYSQYCLQGTSHSPLALCFPSGRDAAIARIVAGAEQRSAMYECYNGPTPEELYSGLAEYVAEAPQQNILISSECFFEWLDPAALASSFALVDAEIHVIAFLRRQDRWLESVYSQIIKDPGLRYSSDAQSMPQWDLLNYRQIFREWEQLVGSERLHIGFYEEHSGSAAIYRQFFQMLGLPGWEGQLQCAASETTNASLDALCTLLQAKINSIEALPETDRQILHTYLAAQSENFREQGLFSPWRLTEKASKNLLTQFDAGNAELLARYSPESATAWGEVSDTPIADSSAAKTQQLLTALQQLNILPAARIEEWLKC